MKTNQSLVLVFVAVTPFLLVLSACSKGTSVSITTPTVARPSVTVALNPSSVLPGQNATLTWSSIGATSCAGSGSLSGTLAVSGSINVMLLGTVSQTYTLECTGAGGAGEQSATLTLSQVNGACTKAQAVRAKQGMQSRAIAAARHAVATGTSGQKHTGRP